MIIVYVAPVFLLLSLIEILCACAGLSEIRRRIWASLRERFVWRCHQCASLSPSLPFSLSPSLSLSRALSLSLSLLLSLSRSRSLSFGRACVLFSSSPFFCFSSLLQHQSLRLHLKSSFVCLFLEGLKSSLPACSNLKSSHLPACFLRAQGACSYLFSSRCYRHPASHLQPPALHLAPHPPSRSFPPPPPLSFTLSPSYPRCPFILSLPHTPAPSLLSLSLYFATGFCSLITT